MNRQCRKHYRSAVSALKETVQELQKTFAAINVFFNVTYTSGSADVRPNDYSDCRNCAFNITKGAVNGAINVFLHNNSVYTSPSSYFAPSNTQIFFERIPGVIIPAQKLAHEVGHLLRFFVNGDPRSGRAARGNTGASGLVDSSNAAEDDIVNSANASMRAGGIQYGTHYVDDYTTVGGYEVTPGRTSAILGEMASRRYVPRTPTALDIYRLGARRVAKQR